MNHWFKTALGLPTAFLLLLGMTQGSELESLEEEYIELVESLRPSVVFIESVFERWESDGGILGGESPDLQYVIEPMLDLTIPEKEYFTGVIVSKEGHIVTAGNAIRTTFGGVPQDAREIIVTLHDGNKYVARPVGVDDLTNIGVIKICSSGELPVVRYADSSEIRVGSWVIVIGNAYGLMGSVSAGMISGKDRVLSVGRRTLTDMIQLTAPVNPGDAGGMVANLKGELIGIVSSCPRTRTFEELSQLLVNLKDLLRKELTTRELHEEKVDIRRLMERLVSRPHEEEKSAGGRIGEVAELFLRSEGINFAHSSNVVRTTVESLIKYGKVRRGFLGVRVSPLPEALRNQLGLPQDTGVIISDVIDGGPADIAGLARWDVVIEFDGQVVRDPVHLCRMVTSSPPSSKVSFKIIRQQEVMEITVELGEKE